MDWQTEVIIPIHKKGNRRECINNSGMSLRSLPEKCIPNALNKDGAK